MKGEKFMTKRIYISADYANEDGDLNVVSVLNQWAKDNYHILDFTDMAKVIFGSVANNNPDCRPCDLKQEFNKQINLSSIVVFVVGDKTAKRISGSNCQRNILGKYCNCTPYKQNSNGVKYCKVESTCSVGPLDDFGNINSYSYLRHEFEQAKKKNKKIVILYNSSRYEESWLPSYMKGYEECAFPFWKDKQLGNANYSQVKKALGYE